jgi:hypothetical protein
VRKEGAKGIGGGDTSCNDITDFPLGGLRGTNEDTSKGANNCTFS